ncbi:outer membrane beta-barrel protein [Kaarinaea lacus]
MKKLTIISSEAISSMALLLPSVGSAAEIGNLKASGFIDVGYVLSDGTELYDDATTGESTIENKFGVSGELDLEASLAKSVDMRFDLDLNGADNSGFNIDSGDSARFEQAYADWAINQNMNLKGGIFNNRLGWEKEDAPDMYQITHGQLFKVWDAQTDDYGNNLTGVEFTAKVSIVTLIAGVLNDLNDANEKNSFKIAADIKAHKTLDVVAGFITQDAGAETMLDAHVTWNWNQLVLGGELLFADKVYDFGTHVTASYAFTKKIAATGRFDYVEYEDSALDGTSTLTIAGLYTIADNLFANVEVSTQNNDNLSKTTITAAQRDLTRIAGDGTLVTLELLATF